MVKDPPDVGAAGDSVADVTTSLSTTLPTTGAFGQYSSYFPVSVAAGAVVVVVPPPEVVVVAPVVVVVAPVVVVVVSPAKEMLTTALSLAASP
jgi:hypothetical protein